MDKMSREDFIEWLNDNKNDQVIPLCYCNDLSGVDLSNLKIYNMNFHDCSLEGTNFSNSKFFNCNFINCNLSEAIFKGAIFSIVYISSGSKIDNIKLDYPVGQGLEIMPYILSNLDPLDQLRISMVCPSEGEFIGYKKCRCKCKDINDSYCIVKLYIPEDAKRSSGIHNKCRCDKALVLDILDMKGNSYTKDVNAHSIYTSPLSLAYISNMMNPNYNSSLYKYFGYKKGEWVYADSFDDDRWHECSNGIHFFMSFEEARDY